MKKSLYFYIIMLLIGLASLWLVFVNNGSAGANEIKDTGIKTAFLSGGLNFQHMLDKLLQAPGILILQLIIIMLVARLMVYLFQLI